MTTFGVVVFLTEYQELKTSLWGMRNVQAQG